MAIFAAVVFQLKLLFPIFLLFTLASKAQPDTDSVAVVDLRSDWKVMEGKSLVPFSDQSHSDTRIIYLEIDPGRYPKGSLVKFESSQPLSVYLNYKLIQFESNDIELKLDGLQRRFPTPWLFGVYQADGLSWLKTEIHYINYYDSNQLNLERHGNYFLDFSIIASIILIIFFIALLQTNPRLTSDYFNFIRLFSIQEREDSLLNSRISASVNILYYLFSSVAIAFTWLTIFHFGSDKITVSESFKIHSLGSAFFQWGKLSLFVTLGFILRLVILSTFTSLFEFKEALSVQFYNSVRLGFFLATMSALACLSIFILGIHSPAPYSTLLKGIILMLIFWVFMVGLKLMRRSPFRFFHLFSYLCASELIPVVILVKVLNS